MTTTADTTPDYRAITERQQRTWALGDFARIGSLGVLHGELLCEALDVHPSERVLDVAAGNGAAALMAENIRSNADNQRHVGLELVGVRMLEVAASA